jgi:hypothetical protein
MNPVTSMMKTNHTLMRTLLGVLFATSVCAQHPPITSPIQTPFGTVQLDRGAARDSEFFSRQAAGISVDSE